MPYIDESNIMMGNWDECPCSEFYNDDDDDDDLCPFSLLWL